MIKNVAINIITKNKPPRFKKFKLVLYTIGLQIGNVGLRSFVVYVLLFFF
jgi:hypothetical protein